MSFVRKAFPHAMILIANMYYVFFGIDRVNKAMNFINNSITKTLLALMCLMIGTLMFDLFFVRDRRERMGGAAKNVLLAAVSILGAVYLLLYLIDLFMGGESGLILNEMVKYMILILCLCTSAASVLEAAQQRRAERRLNALAARRTNSRAAGTQNGNGSPSRNVRMRETQARPRTVDPAAGSTTVRGRHSADYAGRAYHADHEYRGGDEGRAQQRSAEYARPRSVRTGEAGVRSRSSADAGTRSGAGVRSYRSDAERAYSSGSRNTSGRITTAVRTGAASAQRSAASQGYSQRTPRNSRQEYTQYDRREKRIR